MNRREFIAGLGSAAAWPVVARAQQGDRVRRVGVLTSLAGEDPQAPVRVAALAQGLQELGWSIGRNMAIDYRSAAADTNLYRKNAVELIALAPDVILAQGGSIAATLQQESRTVPIVFVNVADPVGLGLVKSLARPGGNATGFLGLEYATSGKWIELLKQIAPHVTRAAILRNPSVTTGIGQYAAVQAVAASLGVELTALIVRDADEIESAVTQFARAPNGGLISGASGLAALHRNLIIKLAAQYRLPAVYFDRFFVTSGGLISYGSDQVDQYRRAAVYVDRILRGERPADLPVQAPTKFATVINLKAAKALGLTIPETLLATADEVIE
jgi:putative ABC transport system substrate-binding protein